jgi:hypothetical protein
MGNTEIDECLRRATRLHGQGKLSEAEPLYREILGRCPDHFDALHQLGVLKCQQSHNEEGTRLIRAALRLRPSSVDALYNLGLALTNLNEPVRPPHRGVRRLP